jgi:hypothetical protein
VAEFKRTLITPEAGPGRREQCDVPGTARLHFPGVLVPDLIVADEALDDFGDNARFLLAHEFGIQFAPAVPVAVVDWDLKTGNGATIGGSGADRRQEGEARLSGFFRQQGGEPVIGEIEDRRSRSEIRRDLEDTVGVLREKSAFCRQIGINIGAPKPIDGLLGIADQEQAALAQPAAGPGFLRGCVATEQPQDLGLQGVGILEFVDQNARVAVCQRLAHDGIAGEKIARVMQEIIKIDESGLPLIVRVKRLEPIEFTYEPRQRCVGDIGPEISVSGTAAVIDLPWLPR